MKLFEPQVLIILLVIVLIVVGPQQLPKLGESLGKTMRAVRDGMAEDDGSEARRSSAAASGDTPDDE